MLGGSPALLEAALWVQRLRVTYDAVVAPLAALHPAVLPPAEATFPRFLFAAASGI